MGDPDHWRCALALWDQEIIDEYARMMRLFEEGESPVSDGTIMRMNEDGTFERVKNEYIPGYGTY